MRYFILMILLISSVSAFALEPGEVRWGREVPPAVSFSQPSQTQPGAGKALIERGKVKATELLGKSETEVIEFLGEPDIVPKRSAGASPAAYNLSYFLKKYKEFKDAVLELTFNKDGEVVTYSVRGLSEIDLLKAKKRNRN